MGCNTSTQLNLKATFCGMTEFQPNARDTSMTETRTNNL